MSAPIEVTTRYVTSVETLGEAWAFVMDRIDRVGPEPTVHISPVAIFNMRDIESEPEPERRFEVVVEGMVHEDDTRPLPPGGQS